MICDAHVHVGSIGDPRTPRGFGAAEITSVLRAHGVSEFIFSSLGSQTGRPFEAIVRDALETKAAFGAGAHAFCWLSGRFFDTDPELKALDGGLWEGVKLHERETPWVKERPGDLERILSILEERGMPVQFHTGEDEGCRPSEILPFVKRHPRLRADFAHCRPCGETIACLKECPNLFADTAFMSPEHYPELVAAGVEDRVMFGTDFPLLAGRAGKPFSVLYGRELGAAWRAGYPEAVMAGNFRRFLGTAGKARRRRQDFSRRVPGLAKTTNRKRHEMNGKRTNQPKKEAGA